MASAVTTDFLSSVLKVLMFDHDPDATGPQDVSWQDMRDFGAVMMLLFHSVGTGNVTSFKILGNPESDGSGTDQEIKVHALGSQPDAVGDKLVLEALASEYAALGDATRYTSASVDANVATDEFVVTYVFGQPNFAFGGLTSDTIA